MDASKLNYSYFSADVCVMYQNNVVLLLIMKTPANISNLKPRTICVHLAGKSASLSRLLHNATLLNHKYYTLKISCKAVPVPKHRIVKAYRSEEKRML
jgi:hypothetical protein